MPRQLSLQYLRPPNLSTLHLAGTNFSRLTKHSGTRSTSTALEPFQIVPENTFAIYIVNEIQSQRRNPSLLVVIAARHSRIETLLPSYH